LFTVLVNQSNSRRGNSFINALFLFTGYGNTSSLS